MLNILWPVFIIISIICSFGVGNIENLNNGIFISIQNSITTAISIFGIMCFWNGIIKICLNTELMYKINQILNPIINILFPKYKSNKEIKQNIALNISSNLLGIGNAATPYGIKAINQMNDDNKNKDKISKEMAMLIGINAASIQIIPTTILAIRQSLNSENITKIIFPSWIVSVVVFLTVVILTKIFIKD